MPDRIAELPYFKVERRISGKSQQTLVLERLKDKIVTCRREFPVRDVLDISYRKLGGEEGIVYLHTQQGVFPYTVNKEPHKLIDEYKKLSKGS
ncbi:hypothetical protein [Paenibacillus sp. y28]|uniref:hypothetical protein n=1 Tax=Paenibacillus sp. y28 TaxID=3129110 RepID=UPI0030186EA9